ncbi:hypothetical protein FN846DRAFT_127446 [Sphaerosporella brunnea]|uniref:Telomerase reverse transcriptase n=1 Tax=Sphaerosporella brunnea TaxID=1250544 RepID=A0A5J5ESQ2_9PEZI|nr:hypothetical protein FN846DRAFT_127446 [Sphaerosporella brunnea]
MGKTRILLASLMQPSTYIRRTNLTKLHAPVVVESTNLFQVAVPPHRSVLLQSPFPLMGGKRKRQNPANANSYSNNAVDASSDKELCALLDSAIVALPRDNGEQHDVNREIADATQRSTGSDQSAPGGPQSEVVDLALSILFARSVRASRGSRDAIFPGKPNNILGLGYYMVHTQNRESLKGGQAGPLGFQVVNKYPNSHVNALKSHLWERLLRVIGEGSMFKLLLDTSIFMRVGEEQDKRMYYQLSGPPISDALNSPTEVVVPESFGRATSTALGKFQGHGPPVKRTAPEIDNPDNPAKVRGGRNKTSADPATLPDKRQTAKQSEKQDEQKSVKKTHGEIVFVKSRRFYAKPAYTARGEILFGLKRFRMCPFDRDLKCGQCIC